MGLWTEAARELRLRGTIHLLPPLESQFGTRWVAELVYRDAFPSKPICDPSGESGLICEHVPVRSGNRSTFDVGTYHRRMKTTRSLDSWMVGASTCIGSPKKTEGGLSRDVYDV
jgi:hypothetical protein